MPARPVLAQRSESRRPTARARLFFWLDAATFTAYVLVFSAGFTGEAVHEWLGLALAAALIIHLTLHWDWVTRTTRRLSTGARRDRLIYAVNLLLLPAMTLCVLSGILISRVALPSLGISPGGVPFWRSMHGVTAVATLILIGIHVALRWRWVTGTVARALRRGPR